MATTSERDRDGDAPVCQVCRLIGEYLDAMLHSAPEEVDDAHVIGGVLRWGVWQLLQRDTGGGTETLGAIRDVLEAWGLHIEVVPVGPAPERVQ